MRYILIILSFFLISNNLFACLSASQNRLFPLGETSKGLCVVETHLHRTEFREKAKDVIEMKPAWAGISYFKIYDENYTEIHSEVIDSISLFEQVHYDSIINISFKKGFELAKNYSSFVAAEPSSITFCDYQDKCSKAKLLVDTIKNNISLQLPNKIKYDVKVFFDSTSIASNLLRYYGAFEDTELSVKSFKGNLYVNSVRQFNIGSRKLTVVHIGSGQTYELVEGGTYPPGNEYKAKFVFKYLLDVLYALTKKVIDKVPLR